MNPKTRSPVLVDVAVGVEFVMLVTMIWEESNVSQSTGTIGECSKRGTRPNSSPLSMYSFFHKLALSLPHGGSWGGWRTFHRMSLTLQVLVTFKTWMMLLIIWRSLITLGNNPSSISLPSYWLYDELVRRSMVELVHESTTSHLADSLSASDQWSLVQNMHRKVVNQRMCQASE